MPAGRFCLRNSHTREKPKTLRDALVQCPVRDPQRNLVIDLMAIARLLVFISRHVLSAIDGL